LIREVMDQKLKNSLENIKLELLEMAAHVERNISDAVLALIEKDKELAEAVPQRDPVVDLMEISLDRHCHGALTLRPIGSDLRFLATALKIVKDLERVGDLAGDICKHATKVFDDFPSRELVETSTMARIAVRMLGRALDAFVNRDVSLAREVMDDDDEVDRLHDLVFESLCTAMRHESDKIASATHLLYIANFLERVGDHSANIAEMVIFMVDGADVRHFEKVKPLIQARGDSD